MEEYVIQLAELCSLQNLPEENEGINKEDYCKFYRQYSAIREPRKHDIRTLEVKQMDAIRNFSCMENIDCSTPLCNMQLDLLKALQLQLEKAFLSKFQISANARKFAGKSDRNCQDEK